MIYAAKIGIIFDTYKFLTKKWLNGKKNVQKRLLVLYWSIIQRKYDIMARRQPDNPSFREIENYLENAGTKVSLSTKAKKNRRGGVSLRWGIWIVNMRVLFQDSGLKQWNKYFLIEIDRRNIAVIDLFEILCRVILKSLSYSPFFVFYILQIRFGIENRKGIITACKGTKKFWNSTLILCLKCRKCMKNKYFSKKI